MKVLAFVALACVTFAASSASNVVCYFASWTIYRPDEGKFEPGHVNTKLCTHVLFAFVGLHEDGTVWNLDPWEADDDGLAGISKLIALKKENPNLKVLLSMGGWNEGSTKYSDVAADPNKRAAMVKSVMEFVEKRGFDGFDLDWEYPCQRQGKPEDKKNFVTLLGELKAALNAKGKILTAAVSGGIASSELSYDIPAVVNNLDMVNLMTYDYHGAFEPFVGHCSPLHASHLDQTPEQKQLNAAAGVEYWLSKGADPKKLNLGLALYGRTFTLADPKNASLYAKTYGGGEAGPYTRARGMIGYNEICALHKDMTYVWDDEQKVPHKVKGDQWYGYEDTKSLELKVDYAKSKNLGGVMVWSLDTDDFRNICGEGEYPLLTAVNKRLGRL